MRKCRKVVPGAYYHVTARTNRQEFILNSPKIKNLFLSIIRRAKKKFTFYIKNFCIMGNHIHLMMKPHGQHTLSQIMQWILATFAINYNKMMGLRGHVWYDRFHSSVIESFLQYIRTFEYITQNPVKAAIVNDPNEYKYSGPWYYRNGIYDILAPPDPLLYKYFPDITAC